MNPQRVLVLGDSGSGKTTVSRQLGQQWGLPVVELDALYHGPNWQPAADAAFRAAVTAAIGDGSEGWVVDGNYGRAGVRELLLERADLIVWLDLPLHITLPRLVKRTLGRQLRREELWNGNRERWSFWLSPEHPIWWNLRRHRDRRRTYGALVDDRWVRLRSPAAVASWLPQGTYP